MSDAVSKDVQMAVLALGVRADQLLSPAAALNVVAVARQRSVSPAVVLLEQVDEIELRAVLAEELDTDFVDLGSPDNGWTPDEDTMRDLDLGTLQRASAIVLVGPGGQRMVAMSDPFIHDQARAYLTEHLGDYRLGLGVPSQIDGRLSLLTADDASILDELDQLEPLEADPDRGPVKVAERRSPIVEWVDNLFSRAAVEGASDVNFMFQRDGSLLVRFKIDGMLSTISVPKQLRHREQEIVGALLNKCPTINPSDKTRPQDGKFSFTTPRGKRIDVRVGTLPQIHGLAISNRILDPDNVRRRLEDMGFAPQTLATMREAVSRTQGMVLLSGPTGAGKTTTLYGLLNELDANALQILTVEDPVEYELDKIGQTQIRSDLGEKSLTFAQTLRAMMRQNPNVILVGEIRDTETAQVAMRASLTGHLLLSTVHANTALGVLNRLTDLGAEPYAVAESLTLSASQRLVRKLHTCAVTEPPTPAEVHFMNRHGLEVPDRVRHPHQRGCPGCRNSGYQGRLPVLEVFAPTDEIRTMVATEQPLTEIQKVASGNGYVSIIQDGFRHVLAGSTTVSELLRCLDSGGE